MMMTVLTDAMRRTLVYAATQHNGRVSLFGKTSKFINALSRGGWIEQAPRLATDARSLSATHRDEWVAQAVEVIARDWHAALDLLKQAERAQREIDAMIWVITQRGRECLEAPETKIGAKRGPETRPEGS